MNLRLQRLDALWIAEDIILNRMKLQEKLKGFLCERKGDKTIISGRRWGQKMRESNTMEYIQCLFNSVLR